MKKLLIFCIVAGLMLAVYGTAEAAPTVTMYTYGDGTTEWTTTTSAVGSSSLQLNDPGDTINYAGVKVTNLGDPTVAEFCGWDYWTRGPEFHGVNMWLFLDTPVANYAPGGTDYGWDIMLGIMPYNILWDEGDNYKVPDDTWVNLQSSGSYPYQVWGYSGTSFLGGYDISMHPDGTTWSEFQNLDLTLWGNDYDFGEATVAMAIMRMGGGGHVADHTGYLDDFTLNGIPFAVEGGSITVIPAPGAILLGSIGVGLVGWLRRRRTL